MPDLTNTVRWLEFVPDILGNVDSPRPFYLLLHGSMSKAHIRNLDTALEQPSTVPNLAELPESPTAEQTAEHEKLKAEHAEAVRLAVVAKYARALEPYVRLGDEPLSFDGKRVASLHEYFELVTRELAGLEIFMEPYRALLNVNTLGVRAGFFSGRLSGGGTSMPSRRAKGQTARR